MYLICCNGFYKHMQASIHVCHDPLSIPQSITCWYCIKMAGEIKPVFIIHYVLREFEENGQ